VADQPEAVRQLEVVAGRRLSVSLLEAVRGGEVVPEARRRPGCDDGCEAVEA
jgi:hypothetical protein